MRGKKAAEVLVANVPDLQHSKYTRQGKNDDAFKRKKKERRKTKVVGIAQERENFFNANVFHRKKRYMHLYTY